ncbi:porin [Paraburkholderia solitsugae]|nr:porin [Paraburkholderia solitsugae]
MEMLKNSIVFAALAGASGAAFSQSTVTLYGVVDVGATYLSSQVLSDQDGHRSGSKNVMMTGGNNFPSIFGLKGVEDLGGGTQAIFTLENSYTSATGALLQPNTLFNHQAYVGLSNGSYGAITFGRQFDPYTSYLGILASSCNGASLMGAHFGDIDNLNFAMNIPNALKYESPTWDGFKFGALYSFGGVAGSIATNRAWSFGVDYSNGPVTLAAGYLYVNHPFQSALGGTANGDDSGYIGDLSWSALGPARYDQIQNANSLANLGVGGSYTFGSATLGLLYTHSRLANSLYFAQANSSTGSDITFDTVELNGTYNVSEALVFGAAYSYEYGHVNTTSQRPKFQIASVDFTYNLSKRTALYGIVNYEHAGGDGIGRYTNPVTGETTFGLPLAQLAAVGTANSANQVAVTVGIRHTF